MGACGRDRSSREDPDAGEASADRPQRSGLDREAGFFQDLPLLGLGRLDRPGAPVEGGVRRPDEEASRPWNGEGDADLEASLEEVEA